MTGSANRTTPLYNELKIGSLNVCGLSRRLSYPEFRELINCYDILAVIETKLDDLDDMSHNNYTYIGQTRNENIKEKVKG